jgi:hypothetical protein
MAADYRNLAVRVTSLRFAAMRQEDAMARLWFAIPLVSLLAAASVGCSRTGAPIGREQVCAVTRTYFNTPALDNATAWDWPEEARKAIEAHAWTAAGQDLVEACGSATAPAVGVAFSEDRTLVQLTRSTYIVAADPEFAFGDIGSIDTCLLRRAKALSGETWRLVACKLDTVS